MNIASAVALLITYKAATAKNYIVLPVTRKVRKRKLLTFEMSLSSTLHRAHHCDDDVRAHARGCNNAHRLDNKAVLPLGCNVRPFDDTQYAAHEHRRVAGHNKRAAEGCKSRGYPN